MMAEINKGGDDTVYGGRTRAQIKIASITITYVGLLGLDALYDCVLTQDLIGMTVF